MQQRVNWSEVLGKHRYVGGAFGWIFLAVHGVINLFRGTIHTFKDDGGAASIAGIDLSQNGEVILALFAGMGITQLLMGVVDLGVAFRYRAATPLLVGFYLAESVFAALSVWFHRPMPVDAPGKFGIVGMAIVGAIAFWSATRRPTADASTQATVGETG